MVPLALALLGLGGGRELYLKNARESFAGKYRDALGTAESLEGPGVDAGGAELAGPPQLKPGSGMLGAVSDPVQQAYLRMLGGVADEPGVDRAQLLGAAGNVTGLQAQESSQGRAQEFQTVMRYGDQDFTAWQNNKQREAAALMQAGNHRAAFALEQYRQGMENMRSGLKSNLSPGLTYYGGPPIGPGGSVVPIVGPQSGTEQYAKGVSAVRGARNAVANVDALTESYMMGGQGREAFGHESGQQAAMFNKLIADMAKMRDLGTMQKSDIEYLESFLPNPSAFFDKLYKGDEALLGTMGRLRSQFADNYVMQREANPWTVGLTGDIGQDLGSGPTRESVAAKYSGRAPADVAARLRRIGGNPGERSGRIRRADEAPYGQ